MPLYVGLAKWTDQGIKNVKGAATRADEVTATIEKAGGRIIGLRWTQGQYDAVTVIEWPDDQSASAAAIAMGMAGNVRTETLRAYTTEEFQRILQKLP
jgi:uncharacterized protein with GYD domain